VQAPVRAHHDHVIAAGRQILRQRHDQLLRRPAQKVELQAGEPDGDVAVTELTAQGHVPLGQLGIRALEHDLIRVLVALVVAAAVTVVLRRRRRRHHERLSGNYQCEPQ